MPRSLNSPRALVLALGVGLVALVVFQGCGDDDDNPVDPGTTPTQLTGVFANRVANGRVTVTIQSGSLAPAHRAGSVSDPTVPASATLTLDLGADATLTGTYEADTLDLAGDGYGMHGVYDEATSTMVGFYNGPNGSGDFVCGVGGAGDVATYCGTFQDDDTPYSGAWNLVIAGDQIHGVMALGDAVTFSGTVTGTGAERTITVNQGVLVAAGTLDTGTNLLAGTFDFGGDPSGTWSAGPCGGPSMELVGTFVGQYDGGRMSLSIDHTALARVKPAASMRAQSVRALGVFTRDELVIQDTRMTFSVAGSYDPETDSLALIGQGYDWTGAYDATAPIPSILGEYRPTTTGYFACAVGDTHSVKVFCGRFENGGQTVSGRWNLMLAGTEVMGMAVASEGDAYRLAGTATGTGTTRTLSLSGENGAGGTLTASGTMNLTSLTISDGTWQTMLDSTPVDSGTWGGTTCPPHSGPGLTRRDVPWEP